MSVKYNEDHIFSYIKGIAMGRTWTNTLQALYIARQAHNGQFRKSGEPYIIHPLTVASHLLSMGIMDDTIIATALLHDYKEDCCDDLTNLPLSNEIKQAIELVSFDKHWYKTNAGLEKQDAFKIHYAKIAENPIATLVKLADRCNNVSTMSGIFNEEKLHEYIDETKNFIIPLIRTAKNHWPQYSDALFIMKYHLISIIDAIEITMQMHQDTN